MRHFELFGGKLHLSLRKEDWMHDYFWRVGLDGGRGAFGAEDVREVASHLQGRDGGIERSPRELEGTTDDCHSAVVALPQSGQQGRKDARQHAQ